MPTYNYRLTGRDIKTLSPVESTDRVLLWGADSIHCSHPGCRFEICAVGAENVMGGAMQEGWGIDLQAVADRERHIKGMGPESTLGIATEVPSPYQTGPWRCAIHLTDEHKPITPEMIAEHCPGPPSPEYQRGHADGFEQGMKRRMAARPAPAMPRHGVDIPDADEIAECLQSHGGMPGISPLLGGAASTFMMGERAKELCDMVGSNMGVPPMVVQTLFAMGILLSSLYFNDKYGEQIEAANNPPSAVQ